MFRPFGAEVFIGWALTRGYAPGYDVSPLRGLGFPFHGRRDPGLRPGLGCFAPSGLRFSLDGRPDPGLRLGLGCFAPSGLRFSFPWPPRPGASPRAGIFRPFGATAPHAVHHTGLPKGHGLVWKRRKPRPCSRPSPICAEGPPRSHLFGHAPKTATGIPARPAEAAGAPGRKGRGPTRPDPEDFPP